MGRYVTQVWPPGADGHEYRAYIPHPLEEWDPQLSRRLSDRVSAADEDIEDTISISVQQVSYRWAADSIMAQGESLSSSAIEGIYASLEGMSMGTDGADAANRAALGNWEMAEMALSIAEGADPLTVDDILELHSTLMEKTETPHLAGRLRQGPAWVGAPALAGMGPVGARFVPPPAEHVMPLLDDLVDYINHSDHPPVLRAAIVHAQFETIHPFPDGNGRTGRALIPIALLSDDRESTLHLPISRALLANRSTYYDALDSFRYEGPPHDPLRSTGLEPWVELLADSIQRATEQVRTGADLAADLMKDWQNRLGSIRSDSAVWQIASELPVQPVFTAESIRSALAPGPSIAAIRRGIDRLNQAGIVQTTGKSGQTQVYRAPEIINLAESVLGLQEAAAAGVATRSADDLLPPTFSTPPSEVSSRHPQSRSSTARSTPWQCPHTGKRTKKQCTLPHDHRGQHRYD